MNKTIDLLEALLVAEKLSDANDKPALAVLLYHAIEEITKLRNDVVNESQHECRDINATECTGVQIGNLGHKLWVCVDGACVLRVKSPAIELTDMRDKLAKQVSEP